MKTQNPRPSVVLAAIVAGAVLHLTSGCAQKPATAPSSSDIVVVSEKAQQIAAATFDLFTTLEYQNRSELSKISPKFKEYADDVRSHGVDWIKSLRDVTRAYKSNRTVQGQANIQSAIATLQKAITQTQVYINAANTKSSAP